MVEVGQRVARAAAADAQAVRAHLDDLTKPVGSLGRLEDLAQRIALIYGDPPPSLGRRCVLTFAASHGIAAEGVSAYGAEVTAQMCAVAAARATAVHVLARACGADVHVIDVGVDTAEPIPGIEYARVRRGTRNFALGAALEPAEVAAALAVGHRAVVDRLDRYDVFAVGELGIGNSTAAAAVTGALLGLPAGAVCGRGTGIDDAGYVRKLAVVEKALERLPAWPSAEQALAEVGGLELCAIAGATIACAHSNRALVTDGFIATAGVLAAVCAQPAVADFVFASHLSTEQGHAHQLAHIGVAPLFDLGMRLGEGTGAVLALPMLDAAARLLRDMATFSGAGVSRKGVAVSS